MYVKNKYATLPKVYHSTLRPFIQKTTKVSDTCVVDLRREQLVTHTSLLILRDLRRYLSILPALSTRTSPEALHLNLRN